MPSIVSPSPPPSPTIGGRVRDWRRRRRLSQLDFALEVEISQKHLSFIESGRSVPSRSMVLRLAESLAVPLRERNGMLLAAGYAPVFAERSLDHPDLAAARAAIERIVRAHAPFPALAVDRHWTLVMANDAIAPLLALVADTTLLRPPVNVLRLSLHPGGLAPHIVNLAEWRAHILERLAGQIAASADPGLAALREDLAALPHPSSNRPVEPGPGPGAFVVPLRLRMPAGTLSLLSTTTVFGTPVDVTLSELAIEAFFPADDASGALLRAAASATR